MGFRKNDPHLKKMADAGLLVDQQTGLPLGTTVPVRLSPGEGGGVEQPPLPPERPTVDLAVRIPGLNLVSEANAHQHHRAEMRRKKEVRAAVSAALPRLAAPILLPVTVTITRVGTGNKPLDGDNLERACKAVRDEIAESLLRCDDGDPRIVWRCKQARGWKPAVVVRVRQRRGVS